MALPFRSSWGLPLLAVRTEAVDLQAVRQGRKSMPQSDGLREL